MLVAVAVSAFVYVKSEKNLMDDLFSGNVEVLANNEDEDNKYTCEFKITSGDRYTFFCGSCDWVPGSQPTWDSSTGSCEK